MKSRGNNFGNLVENFAKQNINKYFSNYLTNPAKLQNLRKNLRTLKKNDFHKCLTLLSKAAGGVITLLNDKSPHNVIVSVCER